MGLAIDGVGQSGAAIDLRSLGANVMRILISTGIFPNGVHPHRGVYILRQAVALTQWAQVKIIAPVPFVPGFVRSGRYSSYAQVAANGNIEGIEVIYPRYYIIPKVFRFLHGVFLEWSVTKTFERIAREFRPDVIVGFFAFPYGFATVRIAQRLGIPVVTGVLGSDINVMAKRGIRRRMIGWTLTSSDRVFSVSRALREKAIELGADPGRVIVVPNGIEKGRYATCSRSEARSRLGVRGDPRLVLCVSNLVPVKGVDILVRAFSQVPNEVLLVVIGDGDERERLRRLIEELGLGHRVRLVGAKPPEEIPLWMSASDLVVLASRAEGHPNVVLEALASGRPVVATRVGGVPEIISSENLGVVVDPEDPSALAAGIRYAFSRSWDEDAIRQEGQKRTWDDVAREILGEINQVTNREMDQSARPRWTARTP